jgi:hypothetical protein
MACDRVGVAVWLSRPAARLRVSVAGRPVRMRADAICSLAEIRCNTYFIGYLKPAGLLRGPRRIKAGGSNDYWAGSRADWALVSITAHYSDGSTAAVALRPILNCGWG